MSYEPEVRAYLDRQDELSFTVQSDGGYLEGPSADGALGFIPHDGAGEAELIREAFVKVRNSSDKRGES